MLLGFWANADVYNLSISHGYSPSHITIVIIKSLLLISTNLLIHQLDQWVPRLSGAKVQLSIWCNTFPQIEI